MANWFVTFAGTELGPLSEANLRQLVASGKLAPEDMVRKEGSQRAVAAGQIKGLFQPGAETRHGAMRQNGSTTSDPSFSAWYRTHVGCWAVALQVLAWVFYGFIWIPAWWALSARNSEASVPSGKARGRLAPLIAGALLLAVLAALGRAWGRRTPHTAEPSSTIAPTPADGQEAAELSQPSSSELTVDRFRSQILGRDFAPKESFYAKYGRPLRVTTIGNSVFLLYRCSDGLANVECVGSAFQYDDDIAPVGVSQFN